MSCDCEACRKRRGEDLTVNLQEDLDDAREQAEAASAEAWLYEIKFHYANLRRLDLLIAFTEFKASTYLEECRYKCHSRKLKQIKRLEKMRYPMVKK